MSAIKTALNKLESAVGKLENSFAGFEQSVELRQRDMFTGDASNQNAGSNNAGQQGVVDGQSADPQTIDGAVLAKRLDSAIGKVEAILKQSA